jgi:hypothetical protein
MAIRQGMIKGLFEHSDFFSQRIIEILFRLTFQPGMMAAVVQQNKAKVFENTGKGFSHSSGGMGVIVTVNRDDGTLNACTQF